MSNKAIVTEKAPAAVGPYSAAIQAGNCIHVSGQLPIDPATGAFAGEDIASQTRQSLTNIKNILEAAGATAWPTSPRSPFFSTTSTTSAP